MTVVYDPACDNCGEPVRQPDQTLCLDCRTWIVLSRLPPPLPEDRELAVAAIKGQLAQGWSLVDVIVFSSCLEEFHTVLSEDVALARMAIIQKKYEERRHGQS